LLLSKRFKGIFRDHKNSNSVFHESHSKSGNQSQLGGINFLPNLSSTQNFKKSITGTIFVSNLQLSLYHALKEKDQFSIFLERADFLPRKNLAQICVFANLFVFKLSPVFFLLQVKSAFYVWLIPNT